MTNLSTRAERPTELQRRNVPFKDVELRAAQDGTGGTMLMFRGYACVTEASYEMQDWAGQYEEVVRSGAFTKTLNEGADVPFLINHGGMTLARTKSGTLQLSEDGSGLLAVASLDPRNPEVQALQSAMDRGDMDEMSFAFWVTRQQWSPDYDQRDILEVNLNKGDVSVVNYGANPHTAGAQMNARDLSAHLERLGEDERREVFERLASQYKPKPVILVTQAQRVSWLKERAEDVREGRALDADTMGTLQEVLDLVATADVAVDEAQVVLSDLMGVPNPDTDDDTDLQANAGDAPVEEAVADFDLYQARSRRLSL